MKTKLHFIPLAMLLFCMACKNTRNQETPSESDATVAETLCFQNEYPFPDGSENIDVLKLDLQIKGDSVTGHYNWLPALKDQRNGTLTGTIVAKTIKATYHYTQEGVAATAPITIVLEADKAIVTGDDPLSGLDTEVAKIPCGQK